jgi:hypothetical protein
VRRTILTLVAVLAATAAAAAAQESIHPKNNVDPEAGLPLYQRKFMPPPDPIGEVPPGWTLGSANPLAGLQPGRPEYPLNRDGYLPPDRRLEAYGPTVKSPPVVINGGMGGSVHEHQFKFGLLKQNNATVEMRGGCWSACTMITSYIPKERLCFAEGAFLAFHADKTLDTPPRLHSSGTWMMYMGYPAEIRLWIDRHGGLDKLTVETFWTMSDRDLWAIGYPRCK